MSLDRRILATIGVAVTAVVVWVVASTQVTRCFSGINRPPRSLAESYENGCLTPPIDFATPIVAGIIILTILIWRPWRAAGQTTSAIGALAGAGLGVATCILFRSIALTLPDSGGALVPATVPISWVAAAAAASAGGAVGWVVGRWIEPLFARRPL